MSAPAGSHDLYRLSAPESPPRAVVASIPHAGTLVPEEIRRAFRDAGQARLPMTDWHLGRLYDFLPALGVTVLEARVSRYVVDLNRDPESRPLYPGRFETGLVPLVDFEGEAIWAVPPGAEEIAERRRRFHAPYHARLENLLAAVRERAGAVLLLDLHSVASGPNRISPALVEDIFLGDRDGTSAPETVAKTFAAAYARAGLRVSRNRPYKGGYITAHYGTLPGVTALQIEMAERVYMDEDRPHDPDEARLAAARERLRGVFVEALDRLAPRGAPLVPGARRTADGQPSGRARPRGRS